MDLLVRGFESPRRGVLAAGMGIVPSACRAAAVLAEFSPGMRMLPPEALTAARIEAALPSKSSTSPQSASHSLPMKASSSAVRPIFGVYVSRRLSSLGAPEKMSRSKPTVPQPRATRSVSEIFGMSFFAAL